MLRAVAGCPSLRSPAMGRLRVGTSGWAYREWIPAFYPERTPTSRMLSTYAQHLTTVEAHNTYRRRPSPEAVDKWAAAVPESFRFAVLNAVRGGGAS